MKLLLDENVPQNFKVELRRVGHDVEHVNSKCKGKSDLEVLTYALKEKRVIVSFDYDFCTFKWKEHYGIIKMSGKVPNSLERLCDLLKKIKKDSLETKDVYFQIDEEKTFYEIKKHSKKRKILKNFQRIEIRI